MPSRLFPLIPSPADATDPSFWRRHWTLLLVPAVIGASWWGAGVVAHELREDRAQPDHGFPFDRPLLDALHRHATPTYCTLAGWFSDLGGPVWWAVYALGLGLLAGLLWRHHYRATGFLLTAVGGTMGLNLLAKQVFGRLRPAFYHEVCGALPKHLRDSSFPSGHTMASLAVAGAVGILCWHTRGRWVAWGLGLIFAGGVAWSRLYLAVHYPSDVLAGWLTAAGWVGTTYLLFARYTGAVRP